MSYPRKLFAAFLAIAVAGLAVLYFVHFRAKNLIPAGQPWTATGSFAKNGAYPFTQFAIGISNRDKQQVDFWGSWVGSDANVGEVHSPVFKAPGILECFLSGYPGKPGLDVYLERQSDHLKFPLTIAGNSFPAELWQSFHWSLPASFRGQPVQLVAVDSSKAFAGWMGVSTPRRFSYLALLHEQLPSALALILRSLIAFALFLLPGFAVTPLLVSRWPHLLRYALILIVACGSALGYLSFYIFFFSTPAGKIFSLLVYLASLVFLASGFRRRSVLRDIAKQVAEPFILTVAATVCYLCFAFVFVGPPAVGGSYIDGRFFTVTRTGDNIIPLIFAEKIYHREPIRPFCCGDWLSSDRPPLQTGIFLLQRPAPWVKRADFDYELLTTALQCLWICGVWSVLASFGTPLVQIRRTLLFLILSGVIFFNSVYTWPKFLAAAFILFVLSIVIQVFREPDRPHRAEAAIAGVCLGLALMSHPGSVYSLLTLPILFFHFRGRFPLRQLGRLLLITVPLVLGFVLPWSAYQKFVDPPGDRLIKWHLAGHPPLDSLTAWQELRAAFSSRTPAELLALRWSNIRYLAGEAPFGAFLVNSVGLTPGPHLNYTVTENARLSQREWFFHAVGVLNAGWLALLWLAARFVWRKTPIRSAIPFAGWIMLIVSVNLIIWCFIEFGPKYTPLFHSSYADFLLLSIGLLGFILALPKPWIFAALAVQLFNFFIVWVWCPPYSFASPYNFVILQIPLLVFGAVASLVLMVHLMRGTYHETNARSPVVD